MKDDEVRKPDNHPIQMAIDPETGRDITYEVITQRLKELEAEANVMINVAIAESLANPQKKLEIYEKYYWMIHERLGMGSIGPATAAAGPLMYDMLDKLANDLKVDENNKIR